ncbi:MAG: hypothetical protein JO242_20835, partial [Streptosporangiaceae bacterium]|nr:hypothetical protein [Streptosporangiaceae bacterium]
RDQVRGSVFVTRNTMGDPDAMEVENNLVSGDMICLNNKPAVQYGDGGAAPNLVRGTGVGECGFGVLKPSPAPKGVRMYVAVSTRSLGTYRGTRTGKTVFSLPPVKTLAGDTIFAQINDIVTTGAGLKTVPRTCRFNPSLPPGQSGEAVLGTVFPNGSSSYEVFETCTFSFQGETGSVTIRAYGTSTPSGVNSGTFLVASGGAGHGGLSTLAGWGTFTSVGQPGGSLRLVSHLRIT